MTRFERSLASVDKADDCQATIACSFSHKREIFRRCPRIGHNDVGQAAGCRADQRVGDRSTWELGAFRERVAHCLGGHPAYYCRQLILSQRARFRGEPATAVP
jgi:hypothetical protein